MNYTVNDERLGRIDYQENFWTGKREIVINGRPLKKGKNNTVFEYSDGETVRTVKVKGNVITGMSITMDGVTAEVIKKPKWYEFALSAIIVAFIMVWGNSPELFAILPLIGGAIGGGVSAMWACAYLVFTRKELPLWKNLLIWLGCLLGTILTCLISSFLLVLIIA